MQNWSNGGKKEEAVDEEKWHPPPPPPSSQTGVTERTRLSSFSSSSFSFLGIFFRFSQIMSPKRRSSLQPEPTIFSLPPPPTEKKERKKARSPSRFPIL